MHARPERYCPHAPLALLGCSVVLCAGTAIHAQHTAGAEWISTRDHYEWTVTSASRSAARVRWLPGGRWEARSVTLRELIRMAYEEMGIRAENQVAGGPDWMSSYRFDVRVQTSEIPGSRSAPVAPYPAGLRGLLADRFALDVHLEAREILTYDLVQVAADGRLGSRITPSDCVRKTRPVTLNGRRLQCGPARFDGAGVIDNVTMHDVAWTLSGLPEVGRFVRDRTGLVGIFEIQFEWMGGRIARPGLTLVTSEPPRSGLSLKAALRAQLGLSLEESRSRLPVLVVDRAESPEGVSRVRHSTD